MRFFRLGRKKGRLGSGVRFAPTNGAPRMPKRRFQWLILAVSFGTLLFAVTRAPRSIGKSIDFDIDSQPILREPIKAEFAFESKDLEATRKKQEEAAANVPDIYMADPGKVQAQLDRLQRRIDAVYALRERLEEAVRDALLASTSDQSPRDVVGGVVSKMAAALIKDPAFEGVTDPAALVLWLTPSEASLPKPAFAEGSSGAADTVPKPAERLIEPAVTPLALAYADDLASLAKDELQYVLTRGVAPAEGDKPGRVIRVFRDLPIGDLTLSEDMSFAGVRQAQAVDLLKARIEGKAGLRDGEKPELADRLSSLVAAAWEMAKPDVAETLFFDQVQTTRERARESVEPVMKIIQAQETIQADGERWTPQSVEDVKTYFSKLERGHGAGVLSILAAHAVLVALILSGLVRWAPLLSDRREHVFRNQNLALLVLCATILVGRVISHVDATGLSVPVTAGTIILAILVNVRLAALTGALAAVLLSVLYGYSWSLLTVTCAMSFAGGLGIARVRRRSDIAGAAVAATGAGFLALVAVMLTVGPFNSQPIMRHLGLIVLNGGLCSLLVPGLLSPMERLSGITTDIQLLEFSDLNNEVLSRLAIEVPATYAHSLMLGQLAEAAAGAVGGNGLLARVCAYYHDIGKLRRPDYFSENQTGFNVHDDLTPRLSARAIASHVAEGVEIAREFHLPQPIVDAIIEHHGTLLVSFFYQQALEQQKHGDVREEDFRYSGPKPQSRETAILMICDAVESGVRSMKSPNEERVRDFVDKIVANRLADRQLDECPLTLKDLDVISEVVTKQIVSSLHARISYPEKQKTEKAGGGMPISGGQRS